METINTALHKSIEIDLASERRGFEKTLEFN